MRSAFVVANRLISNRMDSIETNDFQELTLSQVESLDQELGRGAYERIYKIKYCGKVCTAVQ